MKDLITSIGSVMILLIFVMQFAANQVTVTKFALADHVLNNYENNEDTDKTRLTAKIKRDLASIFGCADEDVKVNFDENGICGVSAPVRGVIACGEMLGMSDEENKAVYQKHIRTQK